MPSVSVVVPTYNPGPNAALLSKALDSQTCKPSEVVVVDSSSSDGSTPRWLENSCHLYSIPKASFNHGSTRNLAANMAQGDILVFVTQDAIPVDNHCLENLVAPIVSGEVIATFARQVPKASANPTERFARSFNYPPMSRVKSLADIEELGYKAYFFSNVCSAVRADVFWEVGGFPEKMILGEDAMLCAKLLHAGYKVKYVARAQVYHSHDYSLLQQFRRNFDLGVSVSQAGDLLKGAKTFGEGLRFVVGQIRYVLKTGSYPLLWKVFAEAAAKFLAFNLGKREKYMPRTIKYYLSMHSFFWRRQHQRLSVEESR